MTSNKQKLSLDHILQASSSSSSSSTSASTYTTNLNQHKRTNSNQHPHHPTTNKPPFLCNLLQSSQMLMYSTSPLLSHNMGRQQSTHNVPGTSTPSSSAASPETLAQQQTPYSESFLYADQPLWAPSASASVSAAPAMALPRSMPSFGAGFCSSSDLVFLDQSQPIFSYDNIQASTSQVSWDTPSTSSYDRRISDAGPSSPMMDLEQDQDQADDVSVSLQDRRRRKRPSRYLNANPEAIARRRERNRKSQRDYRQRKEQRIIELEEQLNEAQKREETLSQAYTSLQAEYSRLLREKTLSPSSASISIASPSYSGEHLHEIDFDSRQL